MVFFLLYTRLKMKHFFKGYSQSLITPIDCFFKSLQFNTSSGSFGQQHKEAYYYCSSILRKEPETIEIITDQKKKKDKTKQSKNTEWKRINRPYQVSVRFIQLLRQLKLLRTFKLGPTIPYLKSQVVLILTSFLKQLDSD